MTKDDVIRMARQAGGIDLCIREQITWIDTASNEFLERFAALVAAAERQRCAMISREFDRDHPNTNYGKCIASFIEDATL